MLHQYLTTRTNRMIITMSTSYDYEIARLVPSNELARRLFSRCYIYCLEGDPWHLNFMISTGQEEPRSDEPIESSTEYDTGSENTSRILQHVGYFTLSFKHNHPRFPLLGWRVGRGNGKMTEHRGVDVLLTDPRDSGSKSIAGVHFRLSMNPQSGYLILNPDNDKAALESYVGSEWRAVEESRLIYEKSTMLRAGDCEYRLNYAFEDGHKSAFIAARNEFVKEYFSGPESTDQFELFNYLPGSNAQIIGDKLLRFGTQGTGTFGWVDQGLDMKTGNVLAIKEMRLKTQREWSAINQERKIGMKFEVSFYNYLAIFRGYNWLK